MATKSEAKKPSHEAFVVTGEGESAFWTKIGGVRPHDDGSVKRTTMPDMRSRLRIRRRSPAIERDGERHCSTKEFRSC